MAYEGKRSAGTKKKSRMLVVLCIILLLIVAGLVWHFAAEGTPKKVENREQELIVEDDVIPTPYGDLSYPGMWTDKVAHEIMEDGSDFKIVFRSTLKNAETELFTLCYGTVPDGGYVMGEMTDGTAVSVVMNAIEPGMDDEVYTLQESVNDLLMQLRENPDFITAS